MTVVQLRLLAVLFLGLVGLGERATGATATHRVRMYFNVGSVDFDLYGNESPEHVENFLGYVNSGAYNRTWIHRSFCCGDLFFLQGGEFYLPEPGDPRVDNHSVVSGSAVPNEYDPNNGLTNSPGTLAAARQSGLDTARNGWFINSSDNAEEFPYYTVFGEATAGFDVVQYISSLPLNHPVLSSQGYNTAPTVNGSFVFLYQVVELSRLDGDFNRDNSVDDKDLAIWQADYNRMVITGPDFNSDKEIDSADLANWEAGYGGFNGTTTFADFVHGDATRNGIVDGLDFLNWQRGFGKTTDVSADADGDYEVTGLDFLIWQRNYGKTLPPPISAVPEPEVLGFLLLALIANPRVWRGVVHKR